MTLPKGCPTTFFKSYGGATTINGSTSAADIGAQRGDTHTTIPYQTHTTIPYQRGELQPYPRRRKKRRDNQSVGKQQPTAIKVTGVGGIMLLPRVMSALVAAGLHVKVRGPGQFSLSRKDAPAALIALRRAKFSPEVT
jgi:hypothetical protein